MSWFYRQLIRPALFIQNAEKIHERTLRGLGWAGRHPLVCGALASVFGAPELPVELFGLRFPNPVGLAAGMDKLAQALPAWAALGFGFAELGAATRHPQPGNPPPRLFRAIPDEAIVNRMGFNNPGAAALAQTLAAWRTQGRWPRHPVGMNLGKSKVTPLNEAAEDYANSFRALWPHVDFFVVNVSSPNTPDLRRLQDKAALDEILAALQETARSCGAPGTAKISSLSSIKGGEGRGEEVEGTQTQIPSPPPSNGTTQELPAGRAPRSGGARESVATPGGGSVRAVASPSGGTRPILVKVAPDLTFEALDEILELTGPRQIAGLVATNTTIARPAATSPELQRTYAEQGGLSGRPLRARSTEVVRHLYRQSRGALPIIGVGGIFDADDAWEKITAGASLVQIYTSLVFEGPGAAKAIVRGLRRKLEQAGLSELRQAVGIQAQP